MNKEERQALREKHSQVLDGYEGVCNRCGTLYKCDVIKVLDALELLIGTVSKVGLLYD